MPAVLLRAFALALALCGSASALANDPVDAHGAVPPPSDGMPSDPIVAWRAKGLQAGELAAGAVIEAMIAPFVFQVQSSPDAEPVQRALIGGAAGLDLGFRYGITDRIGVGVTLPVWLLAGGAEFDGFDASGGPALGDAHLWVPIGLVDGDSGARFALSVVPWLDLPTGARNRLLGDRSLGAGLTLAAGVEPGAFGVHANAGLEVRGKSTFANYHRGSALNGALAASWTPLPMVSLHLETRFTAGFASSVLAVRPDETRFTGFPAEAFFGLRGREQRSGAWYLFGVGTGITPGVGAARARVFLGAGWRLDRQVDVGPEPTTVPLVFVVTTAGGTPVVSAQIRVGNDVVATTDATGRVEVRRRDLVWRKGVAVAAAGFESASIPETDAEQIEVSLRDLPVPFALWVKDQEGNPVATEVRFEGPEAVPPATVGSDGRVAVELPPGVWRVQVAAPEGRAAQERGVVLPPRSGGDTDTEVLLGAPTGDASLELVLRDTKGRPVDDAVVVLDGNPVGSTSTGGTVKLAAIAAGKAHTLEVRADTYQPVELDDVGIVGETRLELVLQPEQGSVRVVVLSAQGPVPDATVRLVGPTRFSLPLGTDGERTFVLRPGSWQLLVASPTFGLQQRALIVPEDHEGLIEVTVLLQPSEDGLAVLDLRVVDPDGQPVDGASLTLDGNPVGETSTGGAVRLSGLGLGSRRLEVGGEHWRPESRDLVLVEGLQEHTVTLGWKDGTVRVAARTPAAMVMDAVARFAGPGRVPATELGSDGEAFFQIAPPGTWQVLVASTEYGLQQRTVDLPPDSRSLHEVEVVFGAIEDGPANLALEVVDPTGAPVRGADVRLDGVSVGTTTNTGRVGLQGLRTGTRAVEVRSELYVARTERVTLVPGDKTLRVQLAWAQGVVRVTARSAQGPVSDALVRFSGPSFVAALPVDRDGRRLVVLAPGRWQALVAADGHALQQKAFEVPETTTGPIDVAFLLEPPAAGRAELLVRVQDPDGRPVERATVVAGGEPVQAPGGVVLLELEPGKTEIEASAPHHRSVTLKGVVLPEGGSERILTLDWEPVQIAVRVRDGAGAPVDAEIRLDGPADVPVTAAGGDGEATIALRPGTWSVLASTAALGVGRQEVVLRPGDGTRTVDLVLRARGVQVAGATLEIDEAVHFDVDMATLRADSAAVLDEIANTLLANPGALRVEIQGHTDTSGGVAYNFELSQRRAEAVRDALVARGVAPERLAARGYGPTRPVADNDTEEGRAANRRVKVELVEQE